jgi:cytochrome c biogenesis protein CcmG, thiol:disulfide interchange protein DsbE
MTLRRSLIAAAVAAVAFALVVAIGMSGGSESGSLQETGDPAVSGTALPPYDPASPDPAVGMRLPSVGGQTFTGASTALPTSGPGVILFVAHWCEHCQAEVPVLVDWFDSGGPGDGVTWGTVSTAARRNQPNWPPSTWLARERYDQPVLADSDDGAVAQAFGVTGFPFWVFVDADGEVAARTSGRLGIEQIQSVLDALR